MSKRIIVHVGLPKCGSTTLQAAFAQSAGLTYWGKGQNGRFADVTTAEFCRVVAPMCDVRMSGFQNFKKHFENQCQSAPDDIIVLSDEILSSIGFYARRSSNSLPQIIENLQSVMPVSIEIFIVLREQRAFFQSYYRQSVANGLHDTYAEYVNLMLLDYRHHLATALNYARLLNVIRPMVKKIHVGVFEQIFAEGEQAADFFNAMGLPEVAPHIAKTHMRPSSADSDMKKLLLARQPRVWADHDTWDRHSQYPTLFSRAVLPDQHGQTLKRFLQCKADMHKDADQMERRLAGIQNADSLFELPDDLAAQLERTIKGYNAALPTVMPNTPWQSLGYLM